VCESTGPGETWRPVQGPADPLEDLVGDYDVVAVNIETHEVVEHISGRSESNGVEQAKNQSSGRSVNQVAVIDEPPIPTSVDGAAEFQANHPSFSELEEPLHPDELYEKYVEVLGGNHEWRVFEVAIHGFEGVVYIWNHQLGHGIRFQDVDGAFQSFVEGVVQASEEHQG